MMSENITCPYCGSTVPAESREQDYDQKVQMRCRNCGGLFEYLPGFGAFSLPEQGPRESSVSHDGSSPAEIYESEVPWTVEQPKQQSSGGTCCAIVCCLIGIFMLLPLFMLVGLFDFFFWLFG